jgi:protein-arginine kinase activator protein McsA
MIDDRLCEICSSRSAKMVVARRRGADTYRTFVCPECAAERAKLYTAASLDFERIIARMDSRSMTGEKASYSCKLCGATLADVVVDGKPGCCVCYSRFAAEIEQVVAAAQGCTHHLGKAPRR